MAGDPPPLSTLVPAGRAKPSPDRLTAPRALPTLARALAPGRYRLRRCAARRYNAAVVSRADAGNRGGPMSVFHAEIAADPFVIARQEGAPCWET